MKNRHIPLFLITSLIGLSHALLFANPPYMESGGFSKSTDGIPYHDPVSQSIESIPYDLYLNARSDDGLRLAPKPGYHVLIDITCNEQGVAEETKIFASDDISSDKLLNQIALKLAAKFKQEPKSKDGKPTKATVRAPFYFPVEEDEGASADNEPKPTLLTSQPPGFPENLLATGESGGAILELEINAAGTVEKVKVLRSSHPQYANAAAAAAKAWTFSPAQKDGVSVKSRGRVAVAFKTVGAAEVDWIWRISPRPSLGTYLVVPTTRPSSGKDH